MRDKIMKLLEAMGFNFDEFHERLSNDPGDQMTRGFKEGMGEEIPEDAKEAARVITGALMASKDKLRDGIVAVWEQHLNEADIDALIAWHSSETGQRMAKVGMDVQKGIEAAADQWRTDAFSAIEPTLKKLLGFQEMPPPPPAPTPPSP